MTERPARDVGPDGSTGPDGSARMDGSAGARLRGAGAVLGGLGVLLAASTAVWPTKVLAVRVPEVGDFTKGYEQRIWSWGREVVYSSDGLVLDAYAGPNPVLRLVLLVAVLTIAAAGLVGWWVLPGKRGQLLGALGTALALGVVLASVSERLSFDDRAIGLQPGLVDVTTTVGWLEVASVLLLTAALVVLLVPVFVPALVPALPPGPPPTRGTRSPGAPPAAPRSAHPAVGFSEAGRDDARHVGGRRRRPGRS